MWDLSTYPHDRYFGVGDTRLSHLIFGLWEIPIYPTRPLLRRCVGPIHYGRYFEVGDTRLSHLIFGLWEIPIYPTSRPYLAPPNHPCTRDRAPKA